MCDDYQNAMRLLPLISRQRADNTADWRTICIALKNCGVPYEIFESWSLTSKYQDKYQIRRAWQNLNGNYSIATLVFYAKLDHGVLPELFRKRGYQINPPVPYVPPVKVFDGEKAFASIIQPYSNCSETELDCGLWERSPYRLLEKSDEKDFCAMLESLYDPDDMLFVGTPLANAAEQQRCIKSVKEHLARPCVAEFFRPNPLTGKPVMKANNAPSFVSDACVALFRYAVLEFDDKPLQQQYAFYMAMLDKGLPIAALTFSGNKSIHCLLAVNCANAEEWTEKVEDALFRNNLELLGCDGACKNESRSSRTPGAIRSSNGVRQRLLYLNPGVKK